MEFYFLEANEAVAHEFWVELSEHLIKIRKHPAQFHFDSSGLRRSNLKKFPYHVLFINFADRVRVQVIRHDSRRSAYGIRRKRS
jgi:hypothetical protein